MVVKKGTSIIELTVVIGLISLLALAISAIMLTTITSSNRVRRATKIKQAGDYALIQIQALIRNSRTVENCDPDTDTFQVINPDGDTTIISSLSDGTTTRIASNSGIYITPGDLQISGFAINCEPSITEPTLIKVAFDLSDLSPSVKASENSTLHFETTTSIRNE